MRRLVAVGLVLSLSACAVDTVRGTYRPAVDMAGRTEAQYDYDLLVCRESARQQDIITGVVIGVLAGAAFGALGGALAGDAGTGAAIGAPAGALLGGAAASAYGDVRTGTEAADPYAGRVKACLVEKGYTILAPKA
jgi:hypothetical protein